MEQLFDVTADAVTAAAVRGSGHSLTHYQQAYLCDPSPLRAILNARHAGFSWCIALEALAEAIANGRFSIFVSLNQEGAAEKILYARDLHDGLPSKMKRPQGQGRDNAGRVTQHSGFGIQDSEPGIQLWP